MPVNPLLDVKTDLTDVTGSAAGGVASVTGNAPVTSSGGANPAIGLTTPLATTYGGTGVATASSFITADGTVPLTATWTAGNYDVNGQNATAWNNVVSFGADPTGSADSATAIQNAINALPLTGGVVYFPAGIYKIQSTILCGNASAPTISTRNGIQLLGDGLGRLPYDYTTVTVPEAATKLIWAGANHGTMVKFVGPLSGCSIKGMLLDGAGLADTGLEMQRIFDFTAEDVVVARWQGIAYKVHAGGGAFSDGGGAPGRWTLRKVSSMNPSATTANGLLIGYPGNVSGEPGIYDCWFTRGNDTAAYSVGLGYTDHISFYTCIMMRADGNTAGGSAIAVLPEVGHEAAPSNIAFYGCATIGGVSEPGTWVPTYYGYVTGLDPWPALTFWPYVTADNEPIPPNGSNSTVLNVDLCRGVSDLGTMFGDWKVSKSEGVLVENSDPIVNTAASTRFAISAVPIAASRYADYNKVGLTIRVRASGYLQYINTPTITIFGKVTTSAGAGPLAANFGAVLPNSAAQSAQLPWSIEYDVTIRSRGATASIVYGAGMGVFIGATGGAIASSNAAFGTGALDLTAYNEARIFAQWSVASASNTITLTQYSVERIGSENPF